MVTLNGICPLTLTAQVTVYKQQERYFVVRTDRFETSRDNWTAVEREMLLEHRWWALPEIEGGSATFAPRELARLLPPILAGEYPPEPIAIDI